MAHDRRKITDDDSHVFFVESLAEEGNDAVVPVVATDPGESRPVAIFLPEFGMGCVEPVQFLYVVVQFMMHVIIEEMPVQAVIVFPFDELAEFAAHKQVFTRMRHPVAIKGPEAGKFLPVIVRHLVQERPFAVDDFIMGQGQDEVFRKRHNTGKT